MSLWVATHTLPVCVCECVFTDAVLLHQGYEVGFTEQLRRTRLSVRHLNSRGLELGAVLVYWDHLEQTQ